MKKILLILILFLVCGCTSTYRLDISNDSFKEEINITEPTTSYSYEKTIDPETGAEIEDDNEFDAFLNGSNSALFSKKSNYKKKVTNKDGYTNINMKYNYSEKTFGDSNALKLCFDGSNFTNKKTYHLHAFGKFYCLYSDTFDIVIHTSNKVLKNNADEVKGNDYIWHINQNNQNNVDIDIEVEKGVSIINILLIILVIILVFVLLFVRNIIKKRNVKNNVI